MRGSLRPWNLISALDIHHTQRQRVLHPQHQRCRDQHAHTACHNRCHPIVMERVTHNQAEEQGSQDLRTTTKKLKIPMYTPVL